MLTGGHPYVVEAAGGATSMTDSFRTVANRGTVIELGAIGTGRIDMTALWHKEAVMIGSVDYGRDPKASIGETRLAEIIPLTWLSTSWRRVLFPRTLW